MDTEVKNRRLELEEFMDLRKDVLSLWPTGQEIDLDEAVDYLKQLPSAKNCAIKLARAKKQGEILLQPRAAVPVIDAHIQLMKCLQGEGGADILPTAVDSYSRELKFEQAQKGLEESIEQGRPLLNGFPIVNHGHKASRQIIESVDIPTCLRLVSPDIRLVAETGFSSGYTGLAWSVICGVIQCSKIYPFKQAIRYAQYVERLVSCYQERGVPLYRELLGLVTSCYIPPSAAIAPGILEGLFAAEQGVKVMGISSLCTGAIMQDISSIRVVDKLGREYMDCFGYTDVVIIPVAHHWLGNFPDDTARGYALINLLTVGAVLGEATEIVVKSVEEGKGIPTKEANAASIRSTRAMLQMIRDQKIILDSEALRMETEMIELETRALLDRALELGDGDVARGILAGYASGALDSQLCPSQSCANDIMVVRDNEGAFRYLDAGNLPFNREILEYNREKIAEREKAEGREADYQMLADDIEAMASGRLVCAGLEH